MVKLGGSFGKSGPTNTVMLKAGALYFAIVIAFFIAVISASLIMLVAHYRNSYLKDIRHQRLLEQLDSGVAYVLSQNSSFGETTLDLFGRGTDSLFIQRSLWGIYELAQLTASVQQDTLRQTFLIGKQQDSLALYLSDEDRPLSISGATRITGNVALPKSGLRQAYAEGKPYNGSQLVYQGKMGDSERTLPALDEEVLKKLLLGFVATREKQLSEINNSKVPFEAPAKLYYVGREAQLENVSLQGKIILWSDSLINIEATAKLTDIIVFAPIIKVASGFRGTCQLFASDSLLISDRVDFAYPSALGVLRTEDSVGQPQLILGNSCNVEGVVFSYEKERSALQTMVALGKDTKIRGEVFCTGLLKLEKDVAINGSVACNRFIMRTQQTLYENFLIDVTFNRRARSGYYLSSVLFGKQKKNKVLKWLN